jgi:hypothetical protein
MADFQAVIGPLRAHRMMILLSLEIITFSLASYLFYVNNQPQAVPANGTLSLSSTNPIPLATATANLNASPTPRPGKHYPLPDQYNPVTPAPPQPPEFITTTTTESVPTTTFSMEKYGILDSVAFNGTNGTAHLKIGDSLNFSKGWLVLVNLSPLPTTPLKVLYASFHLYDIRGNLVDLFTMSTESDNYTRNYIDMRVIDTFISPDASYAEVNFRATDNPYR